MELNKKIKYLFFGNAQSVHLIKWIKALAPLCDVYVISSTTIHPDLNNIVDIDKCFSLYLSIEAGGGNIKILQSLYKVNAIIKRIQPDVVNAHYITSHGLITSIIKHCWNHKFLLIASTWGSDILITPHKNIGYKMITKFILNTSDIITSDAQVMTEEIKKLSNTKILTFTFGLESLPEVSLNEKNFNYFFSNRILSSNYNIDKVIRHFSSIFKQNKEAKLYIANEGEDKAKLVALCKQLNMGTAVEFIGFLNQNEQSDFYRKSGFYYSLPTSDATSVSLLEAMAWACIPIVSDIPANREWITNEYNGIVLSAIDIPFDHEILLKKEEIMGINRTIIADKAIFKNSIASFFNEVINFKPITK
ncbi:MAG: glycosyltransferase [Bacteroidota bacterium]